jgi:hypothetical protein
LEIHVCLLRENADADDIHSINDADAFTALVHLDEFYEKIP